MKDAKMDMEPPLDRLLVRSDELETRLRSLLEGAPFDGSPRGDAAFAMCSVALEHGTALRTLMAAGLCTSSVSLMRLQFEALARAMWLVYAANDRAVEKLRAPLTSESESAAKNLPGASEMIEQIGRRVGDRVPAAAHQMLAHFKDVSWHAMNSFVHGGIHALHRSSHGLPVPLASQVVRNSNGLTTMTGMTLALLTGDASIIGRMSKIQSEFADCLPDLLR